MEKDEEEFASQTGDAKVIFEDLSKRKKSVRRIEFAISAGLWAVFLYLLQFFGSSLFWGLATYFVYGELFNDRNQRGTVELLIFTFFFAIVVFFILFLWASWNRLLYGGMDRRKPRPMPSEAEIAVWHNISVEQLHFAQGLKLMNVLYTEDVFEIERRQSLSTNAEESRQSS